MGIRSELYTEYESLAESNNSLPTFWLLGFNKNILLTIEKQYQFLKKSDEFIDFNKETDMEIHIKIVDYCSNLEMHTHYIKVMYPQYIDLYLDFKYLINSEKKYSEMIYLNISEYINFLAYENQEIREFSLLFESIETEKKITLIDDLFPLDTTIGFDNWNNQYGISLYDNYRLKYYPRSENISGVINLKKETKTLLSIYCNVGKSLFLLLVNLVFVLFSILFILKKDDVFLSFLSLILFGIGIIFEIKSFEKYINQIKTYKKTNQK